MAEGFGATYTLPKSHLLETLTSEPLGRAWTEEELRECCKELGIDNSYITRFDLESLESDCSNGICTSEKSLGEQIIAMAQEVKTSETHCRLPLEPGLEGKPPLPHCHKLNAGSLEKSKHSSNLYFYDKTHDPLFEKVTCECGNGDRVRLRSQSACSLDRYVEFTYDASDDQLFDQRNLESETFIRKYVLPQENLFDSGENNKQFTAHSSSLAEKIINSRSTLQVDYFNKPSNSRITPESIQNGGQVSDHITDIKFQHWFPDSDIIRSSRLTIAEKETDMLLEILAKDQQIFDCTNIYDNLNNDVLYSERNDVNSFAKNRPQELHLECLVEEDVNENETKNAPSTARSNRSDKSHTGTGMSICEIQTVEAASQSNNSQKINVATEMAEQNIMTLEKISDNTKNEG